LQINLLPTNRAFFVSIFAFTAIGIVTANYFGKDYAIWAYHILNLAIIASLVAISILLLTRERAQGNFGRAWVFFASFIILWFTAEIIWIVYELVDKVAPWTSEADIFWLAGYPLYFIFTIYYLKPFRNVISAKLVAASIGITMTIVIFLMYYTMQESDIFEFETMLNFAYPIADTIALAPIIISLVLFFRGQVNFLWSCLLIGMMCFVVSDYGYFFLSLDETYYAGHPIDILYLWAYLFLLSGACDHIKIFRKRNQENRFNDQKGFR
jgi:hypothetical protein